MLFSSANSFVFPQWIRGGGRGGGPRLSPPECLSDPLLGRHLYVKIRVSSMWIQWIHFFVLSEEWIEKCLSDPKAKLRMDHEDLNPPWCQFGWKVWLKKRIIFREQNITMWKMGLGGRSLFCCCTTSPTSGTAGGARWLWQSWDPIWTRRLMFSFGIKQIVQIQSHPWNSASWSEWIQLGGCSGPERIWGLGQTISCTPVQGSGWPL